MPCCGRGTVDQPKRLQAQPPARAPQRPTVRREPYTEINGTPRPTRTTGGNE